MQINLLFQERSISINLINKPVVKKWFDHFKSASTKYSCMFYQTLERSSVKTDAWQNILGAVEILKNIGYKFPYTLPAEFDGRQETLNYLHRFFTYNVLWFHDSQEKSCANPYDPDFIIDQSMGFQQWLDIIDIINVSVHDLEVGTEPHQNLRFMLEKFPIVNLIFMPLRQSHTDIHSWLHFTEQDQELNYTYHDYDETPVILNPSILGKCVLQSFCENDDVNAKDCTGRLGSFGGFMIDLNHNRKKIYESDKFKQWIKNQDRDVETLPLEFPIGTISNFDDHMHWLGENYTTFRQLEFIE